MELMPAGSIDRLKEFVSKWNPEQVCLTGGGASRLSLIFAERRIERRSEFDAWATGAKALVDSVGQVLPNRYLLVSVGTGTSILEIGPNRIQRRSGMALGGGTIVGLARQLGCAQSFGEFAHLAERGDRRNVDLLVGDIYIDASIPLKPDLVASSFGKSGSKDPADIANAVMGLVAENIGILCSEIASTSNIDTILIGGGTLVQNPVFEQFLQSACAVNGTNVRSIVNGVFCGSVGAALGGPQYFLSGTNVHGVHP
jgi:type II pantothenate kinase